MNPQINLIHVLPETLVLAVAIIVIIGDIWSRRRDTRVNLAYIAIIGLGAPLLALGPLVGRNEVSYYGTYVIDPMAVFFKALFILAAGVTLLLSVDYVRDRGIAPGEYYATMLFATFGFMFLASSRELITAYVSLEMASISLYVLVGIMKTDQRAAEAALKYLLMGAMSSAAFLYGMVLLYGATGTTILPQISTKIADGGPLASVAIALIVAGIGFKIAVVPFHLWVPDVYEGAATPTTAFLSVASKAAGFALAVRVFGQGLASLTDVWAPLLAVLAAITMTVGNVAALRQTNVKRMLGYSSIGQAGYVLMALAAFSPETASGLMYFLLAYVLTNLGAFAGIVAIGNAVRSDDLAAYRGLSRRAGWLSLFTTLCFLSLIGMPPMGGFVSKFYLFLTVFQQGMVWLVLIAVLNTAIAAYYYIKVIRAMYFAAPLNDAPIATAGSTQAALWFATVATILVGIVAAPFIQFTDAAGRALFR
ncbi:MAG: NADH-quinone oxidoreductase subunit N [Chloroflexota bacterium]|nr:MAG: NADH-quinone oxidoreductase subunit N [Chloroflexota bacterium]